MITKQEFHSYIATRASGVTNMCDLRNVKELTSLTREKIKEIMRDFDALRKKYGY